MKRNSSRVSLFYMLAILPRAIVRSRNRKAVISIKRMQLPFVPGYAFTTHKCQGQTLQKVVIDLQFPLGQRRKEVVLTYVPISRFKRLTDVAFLRDFPLSSIQIKPSQAQLQELTRLALLDEKTKERFEQWNVNRNGP